MKYSCKKRIKVLLCSYTLLLGDRILVCESDYQSDVKPEAMPQFLFKLQNRQRIGAEPV